MKRDADMDRKMIARLLWMDVPISDAGILAMSAKALRYWIRRAEALEVLLNSVLDETELNGDICPTHKCGGGSCEDCWQKAKGRCGEE